MFQRSVELCRSNPLLPALLLALEGFGLVRQVGEENVFEPGPGAFNSAKRALARAEQIIGPVVEDTGPPGPGPEA